MKKYIFPKWIKEIEALTGSYQQFMLYGNVRDYYLYSEIENDKRIIFVDLIKMLKKMLEEKQKYSIIFKLIPNKKEVELVKIKDIKNEIIDKSFGYKISELKMRNIKKDVIILEGNNILNAQKNFIETILNFKPSEKNKEIGNVAIIYDFSSNLKNIYNDMDRNKFLLELYQLGYYSRPIYYSDVKEKFHNLFFWIFDKDVDLERWYLNNNHFLKSISIPAPDIRIKREFIKNSLIERLNVNENQTLKFDKILDLFVSLSSNFYLKDIENIITLAKKREVNILEELEDLVKFYKIGIEDNPWKNLDKEKIKKAQEILSKDIIGQEYAVKRASGTIKRAFFNLSGIQFSINNMRPKGVLFFAGPTGVGKTELAKSMAKLIFGTQDSYIRFDMSEFSKEHSDQRLIGSPPGYVGYEEGGELVNKIKENPFSVVLFDEIEKAHRKIFDIFLQILDEGRLTSSRGDTVYFSESIIIFTSNLGVYNKDKNGKNSSLISPESSYEKIKKEVEDKIKEFFIEIGRPEILNRIGENVIVFDFIREEHGKRILEEKMLKNLKEKLKKTYGISFEISNKALKKLYKYCLEDLTMGGRGIGNKLEKYLITPLSEKLFDYDKYKSIKLVDIDENKNDKYELILEGFND
ncbi:AAA family ATPase [Marinitoga sp. 1155]|uniref:AAA family ATPase n=1 Tax=Marinitoga sp. 1155 TaxID=1428448 RepID=UPI000658E0B1|nr:AAA family ATPase [Marinitoga sp. 1155]KLO23488.1 ATPase AAA [Marinitoga sp. 1155]